MGFGFTLLTALRPLRRCGVRRDGASFQERPQSLALARKDLAHALRRKAERNESRPDVGDLSIFDNQAVAQLHDRNAFEADAPSLRFWKSET